MSGCSWLAPLVSYFEFCCHWVSLRLFIIQTVCSNRLPASFINIHLFSLFWSVCSFHTSLLGWPHLPCMLLLHHKVKTPFVFSQSCHQILSWCYLSNCIFIILLSIWDEPAGGSVQNFLCWGGRVISRAGTRDIKQNNQWEMMCVRVGFQAEAGFDV